MSGSASTTVRWFHGASSTTASTPNAASVVVTTRIDARRDEPQREHDEEDRRERCQVAAQQVRCEARGEEPDLDDDEHDRGDGDRDQRASVRDRPRLPRIASTSEDDQALPRGITPTASDDVREMVVGQPEPAAERVVAANRRGVCAEAHRDDERDGDADAEHGPDRPERA